MHSSGLRILLKTVLGLSVARSVFGLTFGFPYGQEKVRGVNLGGWLVLEPWITPSIFDDTGNEKIVDEWTFGQYMDKNKALNVLEDHWESWITEDDFEDIADAGLNHVRIPIGYWAFETKKGEPYISGQLPYLQKAFHWAAKHNLKVIIDLHGAPGSQNGFDNSGQRMPAPKWHTDQENVDRTSAIIERIASQVQDMTGVVPVIAPLNEPAGYKSQDIVDVTKRFWKDSYQKIRHPFGSPKESNLVVMIHDAFQPVSSWKGFMQPPQYDGVILDTHIYQVFSDEMNGWSQQQHIKAICNRASGLLDGPPWVVVGEFSPASTDCAKYLNGRGVGARYDGTRRGSESDIAKSRSCASKTGDAEDFSNDYKKFLGQFWEAQVITYEKVQGWVQWTWKAENADEWSYQAGLEQGWIPEKAWQRKYPNICDQ